MRRGSKVVLLEVREVLQHCAWAKPHSLIKRCMLQDQGWLKTNRAGTQPHTQHSRSNSGRAATGCSLVPEPVLRTQHALRFK
jgi:hypothetical protein